MNNIPIIARANEFNRLIDLCRVLKQNVITEDRSFDTESNSILKEIQETLEKIFPNKMCVDLQLNHMSFGDIPFGIIVNPILGTDEEVGKILFTDEDMIITVYMMEIDSNILFNLDAEEIAAYIVEEIFGITNREIIPSFRALLDVTMYQTSKYLSSTSINSEMNMMPIIQFGIKDTIRRIGSLIYKDEETIGANVFAKAFETTGILYSVVEKMRSGFGAQEDTESKTNILNWVLNTLCDIDTMYNQIKETLETASKYTSSVLIKNDIDMVLKQLEGFSANESTTSYRRSAIMESLPFFTKLKRNGLKQIEDDYYEFKVRTKNCDLQEDAIYILRQINYRLGILDDYVINADISDYERSKYTDLIYKFRDLREEVGKKAVKNKRNYGIFVDYDKLDALDM